MRIALCGGTGDIGEGLALRWARDSPHEVIIGSRDPERARTKAAEYEEELASRGVEVSINGFANEMAADRADVVVLSVPAYHLADTIEAIADRIDSDTTLVSPAVGMKRDDAGFHYNRPSGGSVVELAANAAPDDVPVIGAFHNLAAGTLANLDVTFELDTIVLGDDADAKGIVMSLAADIDGLRALDGGGIANAAEVEGITPLLINIAMNNEELHDLGVVFR
ncbi:NADPH-dependent F420 reductase [Halocatena marina]|uniref:NADPH-dependent F420 reductase n=1 Tax=Halocatena marina TaxID=2934937 RepID=A0ABD5YPB3_9EURY|nr:NADPH-dependent F420 reductase [Halocatena marina]